MGRIQSDKISKFYCNTCEKDYEGTPKIDYESPNEEVADNLILVERGQYVCTTCGSTIAEYREFKKPDEVADVGYAKPVVTESVIPPQPSENIEPAIPDFDLSSLGETPPQVDFSAENQPSFSSIVGMDVYDENARKIGIAKQVGVESTQSVVLIITKNDGTETSIPWNEIKKIGEIIFLGKAGDVGLTQTSIEPGNKCPGCGFDNKIGSKFCENCGTQI